MADEGFEVRSPDLTRLSKQLKEAGDGRLRRELLAGIRKAGQAALPAVRHSAEANLPHSGGLAERVSHQKFSVRTSLANSGAQVRLVGQGMKELADINAGRLRHPVFGNREAWSAQSVTPGFFTDAVTHRASDIRAEIQKVMDDVAHQIVRGT